MRIQIIRLFHPILPNFFQRICWNLLQCDQYTSLLSLIWSTINCLRAYEPKDPSNKIISNDENRQFPFSGVCTFWYLCNSELYLGFGFLFLLDLYSSDSSDEEYFSGNIMSSSTFILQILTQLFSDINQLSQN